MEFLQELLPFLVFGIILITKSRKRLTQQGQKGPGEPVHHRPRQWSHGRVNEGHSFEQIESNEKTQPEVTISTNEDHYDNNEFVLDQYITQQRQTFEEAINTPGVVVKENTEDMITKTEIGRNIGELNRRDILNGIILSEVLGKPKALRK